jgi:hypothetical protein
MRPWMVLGIAFGLLLGMTGLGQALPMEDPSQSHGLGVGLALTAPFAPPNTFPASGISSRLWIADLFGLSATFFLVDGAPSVTGRAFIKFVNTPVVDLYVGSGAAFFISNGIFVVPLQAVTGLEIRIAPQIALHAEVGLLFRGLSEVTAGMGVHFYF